MSLRQFGIRTRTALALFALVASAALAVGQERAPRRPPEPFRVFADFVETADAALKARLDEALPMVRERVKRRGRWFQLADSLETADIVLRITHYRQANLNLSVRGGRTETMYADRTAGFGPADGGSSPSPAAWVVSSVGERSAFNRDVEGSIPSRPTTFCPGGYAWFDKLHTT